MAGKINLPLLNL